LACMRMFQCDFTCDFVLGWFFIWFFLFFFLFLLFFFSVFALYPLTQNCEIIWKFLLHLVNRCWWALKIFSLYPKHPEIKGPFASILVIVICIHWWTNL
jgi:hypothetical protein